MLARRRPHRPTPMTACATRRCIVTGEVLPEGRLVRFVAAPDGQVVPDVEAKLPGRGMWVSGGAQGRRAGGREGPVRPRRGRGGEGRRRSRRRGRRRAWSSACWTILGLRRRAGDLILGFDQVERALRAPGAPAVIVEASDAAADGGRKLQAAARASGIAPFVIGALQIGRIELGSGTGKCGTCSAQIRADCGAVDLRRRATRRVPAAKALGLGRFFEGAADETG